MAQVQGEMVMKNCSHCMEQCGKVSCSDRSSLGGDSCPGCNEYAWGIALVGWQDSDIFFSSMLQNSRNHLHFPETS